MRVSGFEVADLNFAPPALLPLRHHLKMRRPRFKPL
jgi:hypothetical protein